MWKDNKLRVVVMTWGDLSQERGCHLPRRSSSLMWKDKLRVTYINDVGRFVSGERMPFAEEKLIFVGKQQVESCSNDVGRFVLGEKMQVSVGNLFVVERQAMSWVCLWVEDNEFRACIGMLMERYYSSDVYDLTWNRSGPSPAAGSGLSRSGLGRHPLVVTDDITPRPSTLYCRLFFSAHLSSVATCDHPAHCHLQTLRSVTGHSSGCDCGDTTDTHL
ncbi:hypothetical protein J6590_035211 [Homalodisca vitripennis]|nr:hypothetical protein J6590_035211 [Homalodisca vitripennis]